MNHYIKILINVINDNIKFGKMHDKFMYHV